MDEWLSVWHQRGVGARTSPAVLPVDRVARLSLCHGHIVRGCAAVPTCRRLAPPGIGSAASPPDALSRRHADAELGEPGTTGYCAMTSLDEPSHVMIWERYNEGGDLKLHTERRAHAQLMEDMGSRKMTKRAVFSGLSFDDIPGVGYWGRGTRVLTEKQQARGTLMFIIAFRFQEDWMRDKWIEIMTELADWDRNNEPGTLTYAGGILSADLAKGDLDLKKGDFLWASEFADARAMQEHQDEPHHVAVGKKGAEAGCVMENVWTGGWRVTPHGFVHRTADMPAADPAFDAGEGTAKL
jgi:quinol monooxygenase YgiN